LPDPDPHPSLTARVTQLEEVVRQLRERERQAARARAIINGNSGPLAAVPYQAYQENPDPPRGHRKPPRHLRLVKALFLGGATGGLWAVIRKLTVATAVVAVTGTVVVNAAQNMPYSTRAPSRPDVDLPAVSRAWHHDQAERDRQQDARQRAVLAKARMLR
jgi:hypothetical protein